VKHYQRRKRVDKKSRKSEHHFGPELKESHTFERNKRTVLDIKSKSRGEFAQQTDRAWRTPQKCCKTKEQQRGYYLGWDGGFGMGHRKNENMSY